MKYTIEEILQMQEGQTFDRKSILIGPSHLATIIVAMAKGQEKDKKRTRKKS